MSVTGYGNQYSYNITQWVAYSASGASGMSGANVSGASGYNVSGASGYSITIRTTVEGLDFTTILNKFTTGNLEVSELVKWLKAHAQSYEEPVVDGNKVTCKFVYNGKDYTISCSKSASDSQFDKITETIIYSSQVENLRNKYMLTDEEINEYFVVAFSGGSYATKYMLNPNGEYKTLAELEKALKADSGNNSGGLSRMKLVKKNGQATYIQGLLESQEILQSWYNDNNGDTEGVKKLNNYLMLLNDGCPLDISIILRDTYGFDVSARFVEGMGYLINTSYNGISTRGFYMSHNYSEKDRSGQEIALIRAGFIELTNTKFFERMDFGEFDKTVSAEEAEAVIKEFTDLLKADLKAKYNFSDDFLDKIVEFAKREVIIECLDPTDRRSANLKIAETGDNYWKNFYKKNLNLKDVLNSIKNDIEEITKDAKYSEAYFQSDEWFSYASMCDTFITEMGNSKQKDFLSYLYHDAFYKLGIDNFFNSDYDEEQEFISGVLCRVAEKIGVDVNEMTPMDIMTKLDKNGNNSWLDELSDCINEVFKKTYVPNYQTATTVNSDVLLGDNEFVDAKYISDHLVDFKFSGDAGTMKFNDMIHTALRKFGIDNDYDEIEVINALIKFLNNKADIENTNPPTLSKEAINILNEQNIFDTIQDIINSNEFRQEYYFGSIDGEIGYFGQGGTGDCWLLAGVNALRSSEAGRQMIKDSISYDEERGVYVVTFKGVNNKSYDITPDEIEKAIKDSKYAYGDRDVYLLERAMEKLMYDIWEGKVEVPKGTIPKRNPEEIDSRLGSARNSVDGGMLYGGWSSWLTYAITGHESESYSIVSNDHLYGVLGALSEQFQNGDIGIMVTFNYTPKEGDIVGWNGGKIIETENGDVEFSNSHAYTIIGMTIAEPSDPNKNTITIVNPWYPDRECTITWAEFAEIGVSSVEGLNITGVEFSDIDFDFDSCIDKLFEQAENGEITYGDLINKCIDMRDSLSSEAKDYIVTKLMVLGASGVNIILTGHFIIWLWDVHSYSTSYFSKYTRFEYNGSTYTIDYNNPNKLPAYLNKDIYQYTTDNNIINKYFDIVGTKDGEPLIYRLKEGVTFDDFLNAV